MKHRTPFCETLEHRRLLASSISIGSVVDTAYRQTAQDGLIVVTRKGDLSEPLVVPLIVGGTAQNVAEYGRIGPQLTIPAGERSVALPVRPVFPGPAGQSNFVSVSIGQIDGIRYGSRTANVNILDNPDSTPPLVVENTPPGQSPFLVGIQQRRGGSAFVITRTGDLSLTQVVDLSVGGTAQNGVDFGRIGNQITFDVGQTTLVLPVRTPQPGFTGNRNVTISLPGALPVSETSLVLNGIDLTGNVDPIVEVPDPVFPGSGPGVGIDPDSDGVDGIDTGVGVDPGDIVDGIDTGVGVDPTDGNELGTGVGFDPNEGTVGTGGGFGSGVADDGLPIGAGSSVGNNGLELPGAVPTRRT